MMLRNESCGKLLSTSKKENGVNDPMEVELLVILRVLQIYIPIGISELVIESNSLLMFKKLLAIGESMSVWGNLVYTMKNMMKMISRCSIQHKGHMANVATHTLAKYVTHLNDLIIW